jgi:hypothetical protein
VFIATTQKLKYWRNPKLDSSVGSAAKLACELVFARAVRAQSGPVDQASVSAPAAVVAKIDQEPRRSQAARFDVSVRKLHLVRRARQRVHEL